MPQARDAGLLSRILQARGVLPPAEALSVLRQLLEAIGRLHQSGRIHRAIRPDAVSIDAAGTVTLDNAAPVVEFLGHDADPDSCPPEVQPTAPLALPADAAAARKILLQAGIHVSPARFDVYQLAVLLVRMLTGQSVDVFLRSPRVKSQVPAELIGPIVGALGFAEAERITEVSVLAAALAASRLSGAAETPPHNSAPAIPSQAKSEVRGTPLPAAPAAGVVPREHQPPGRLAHYRILRRIGQGGMGDVYLGFEEELHRQVAIKVLPVELARSEDLVRRFLAEAAAVAQIAHPHVVPIYYIGHDAGQHFYAMQYVEGESLDRLLARQGRLSVEQTLAIVEQCLAGLQAVHQAGLIHRDIKPANILLDAKTQRALVADFGLVKAGGGGATASGVVLGTVDYMAPEVARGQKADARSDLYAVGVMAYQMISGRLPFMAETPTAVLFQHAYESPSPLRSVAPDVPESVAEFIDRLMAKAPGERYADCAAAMAALRRCRTGGASELFPSSPSAAPFAASLPELGFVHENLPRPWWQRVRERVAKLLSRKSGEPPWLGSATVQDVDRAVASCEARRDRLGALLADAQSALMALAAPGPTGAPDDGAQAVAEVEANIGELNAQLADADATLARLHGQRDLFKARLRAAETGDTAAARAGLPRPLLIGAGLAAVVAVVLVVILAYRAPRDKDRRVANEKEKPLVDAPPKGQLTTPAKFTNALGMEFALVPKGKTWLGGGAGKPGPKEVESRDDFYLGVYEVTQEEWAKVAGTMASHFSRIGPGRDTVKNIPDGELKRFPVENVSWDDCQAFLDRLNKQAAESGWLYRLPTEEEWEYACRGGPLGDRLESSFDFYFGKPTNASLPEQANFDYGRGLKRTRQVGSYPPNRLGLYDMHGNVWEWCHDDRVAAQVRPCRGGSWKGGDADGRAARRGSIPSSNRNDDVGLRLARVPTGMASPGDAVLPSPVAGAIPTLEDAADNRAAAMAILNLSGSVDVAPVAGASELKKPIKLLKELADIKGPYFLTGVQLTGTYITDDSLKMAFAGKKLRAVETFHLGNSGVRGPGLRYVARSMPYLRYVYFANDPITDAGLQELSVLRELRDLSLSGTKVTDGSVAVLGQFPQMYSLDLTKTAVSAAALQGLEPLEHLSQFHAPPAFDDSVMPLLATRPLKVLDLAQTAVTDAGLVHLREKPYFVDLNLDGTAVTDAGLDAVNKIRTLVVLSLNNTRVTDAGLAKLKSLDNLYRLHVMETAIGDDGLTHLKQLKTLSYLDLTKTKVTGDGLRHLTDVRELRSLFLNGTATDDRGLKHLAGIKSLTTLWVKDTNVTPAGIKELKAALPGLTIWPALVDAPVKNPVRTDPKVTPGKDREVIEWVIDNGGSVQVISQGKFVAFENKMLLKDWTAPFQIQSISGLYKEVTDTDLRNLAGARIMNLHLNGTKVTGSGLAYLKDCQLASIRLGDCPLTDVGLEEAGKLTTLTGLELEGTKISDAGLVYLKSCPRLEYLKLEKTQITDAGLANLRGAAVREIVLDGTRVTDDGLRHLQFQQRLRGLALNNTGITDRGLEYIGKNMRKLISLKMDRTKITDEGVAHLQGLDVLAALFLRDTAITNAAVPQLGRLTTLRQLDLVGTRIDASGKAELRKSLPNLVYLP